MGHRLIKVEKKIRILELTLKALDNEMTSSESQELQGYVASSKELASYYSTCVKTHLSIVELEESYSAAQEAGGAEFDKDFWQMMSLEENFSPAVEIPVEEPQRVIVPKIESAKMDRRINKFSLVAALISLAAVLTIILYVQSIPVSTAQEIAILSDSIHAKWTDPAFFLQDGDQVFTNDHLSLSEGIVEFTFANGVKLILEGPARFEFEDLMQIYLERGRLVASVTQEAKGFTVRTNTATVVDYGTEFGVVAETGLTQAHVFSGVVDLRGGSDVRYYEQSMRLQTGQAAVTNAEAIHPIELRSEDFYTHVPTSYEILIRQLKPAFYCHAAQTGQVVRADASDFEVTVDDSIRCVSVSQLDRQPHEYAWDFDGTSGGILFSGMEYSEEGYVIAFWVKPDTVTAYQSIFTAKCMRDDGMEFYRHVDTDLTGHVLQYYINSEGKADVIQSLYANIKSTHSIETGQWYHIAVLSNQADKSLKLLINGNVIRTNFRDYQLLSTNCNDIYLGGIFPGQPRVYEKNAPFSGKISDVLYLNRPITVQQMKQLYEASLQKKSD